MSNITKTLAVAAAISTAAFVSQMLLGQDTDQAESTLADSTQADSTPNGAPARPDQKLRRRSRPRADGLPLVHAILKEEEESAEEKILAALDKPTSVDFTDLALEDALAFLHEYHGINIWPDKSTLADEGVALDQPVTLRLAGVRFESVLNLLLQPLQLDWIVQDEVLKITTSAWAYDHPEVQTYDVQNLIEAGHTPEELIAAITTCVEPGTWIGKDATAGISHTGGVLVVRHTQRAHSEVGRLIADLDDIAAEGETERRGGEKNAVVSIRVYRTGNQPADEIAEALQVFVARNSWKSRTDREDDGEIRALQGALVVKQTADVHRSIQRFLAQFEPKSPAVRERAETPPPAAGVSARASPDPFGVLDQAGLSAAGARHAARADRPKSPIKKKNRPVARN